MQRKIVAAALAIAVSTSLSSSYAVDAKAQPQLTESQITAKLNRQSAQPLQASAVASKPRQTASKNSARAKAIRRAMAIRARIARTKKLKQQQS